MKTLKRKITSDSVMEEIKKKLGDKKVKELTDEGYDAMGNYTQDDEPPKKADTPAPNPDSGAETAKGPEPAPPSPASTDKGPPPAPGGAAPSSPSAEAAKRAADMQKASDSMEKPASSGGIGGFLKGLFGGGSKSAPSSPPAGAPARGGFSRGSAAMIGPTETDKAQGPANAAAGTISIDKPGDIAKVDTSTAKGIGGTASTISQADKDAKAASMDAADKAAGLTPKEPVKAADTSASEFGKLDQIEPKASGGRGSVIEKPGARAAASKPAAPKPAAAPQIDTAAIYAKHGVGGSNEDAGAFHRAEAEIKAMRAGAAAGGKKLKENFDQFAKRFVQEQNGDKYIKKQELKIIDPDHKDPSSPNRGHVKNEEMATPGLGARHNPEKNAFKTDLHKGSRNWGGNQKRTPSTYAEEATQIVKKKVMEKKKEAPLGSTSTGKKGESIDLEPVKPELTGYH